MFPDILANLLIRALASRLSLENEDQIQAAIAKLVANNLIKYLSRAYQRAATISLYKEMIQASTYDEISLPAVNRLIEQTLIQPAGLDLIFPVLHQLIVEDLEETNLVAKTFYHQFCDYLTSFAWPDLDILDRREYCKIEPAERFLTYFASLLKFKPGLSACTAITLAPALDREGLQLFIACNLASNKLKIKLELLHLIFKRLDEIQNFLTSIRKLSSVEVEPEAVAAARAHEDVVDDAAACISPSPMKVSNKSFLFKPSDEDICSDADCKGLALKLLIHLGYSEASLSAPDSKLLMMAAKVIFALVFDKEHEILPDSSRQIFSRLNDAVVILPRLEDAPKTKTLIAEMYTQAYEKGNSPFRQYNIFNLADSRAHFHLIRLIHAEQLLVFLLDKLKKRPPAVGINLLCCSTCSEVLTKMNVRFFGVHHSANEGVLNFYANLPQSADGSRFFHHVLVPKPTPPRPIQGSARAKVYEHIDKLTDDFAMMPAVVRDIKGVGNLIDSDSDSDSEVTLYRLGASGAATSFEKKSGLFG